MGRQHMMPAPWGEDLHEEGVCILRASEEGRPGGCPGADVYFQARHGLALGREHDVPGVVLEGGVLRACSGLGLSQDEEGGAAHCHVQGLCQEALPQVWAPDIKPQVPHGVDVPQFWDSEGPGLCGSDSSSAGVGPSWGLRLCAEVPAAPWAARRSRSMRPKTVVREAIPGGRSPVTLGSTQSRRAGARAPRTLKPTGLAGWRARA